MQYLVCMNCNGYYELKKGETIFDFDSCQCGGRLRYANFVPFNEAETVKNKELEKNKTSILKSRLLIRLIGIIIGTIIIFMVETFILHGIYLYLSLIILGGLITSLITGGKYKDGAINGFIVGFLGVTISLFYLGGNPSYEGSLNITYLAYFTFGYSIVPAIITLSGGLIGIFIKNHVKK